MKTHAREIAVAALVLSGIGQALATVARPDAPLGYAFKFASAIKSDPKDMGKMQQAVVLDYAYVGDLDTAVSESSRVTGWRSGVVYAELARQLASRGRTQEAWSLVHKAQKIRDGIKEGWQGPRIASRIASALAALGEVEQSKEISTKLAGEDPLQYSATSVTVVASALATKGDFDAAMERLALLKSSGEDFEAAWGRTMGYLDLARRSGLTDEQRSRALAASREAADEVTGWRKADALQEIASEQRARGDGSGERQTLEAIEEIVNLQPDTATVKIRLLGDLSRAWSRAGEKQRARKLLDEASGLVPNALNLDRPGLYAELASSYMVIGEKEHAWTVYGTAFDSAEALGNARPRAIAVIAICRSMGRNGVDLNEETRGRLDSLYSGLKDPW